MEYGKFYLIIRKIAQLVFPKYKAPQLEPTDKPVVYVSHHQNMFGPVNVLLWYPKFMRLWGLSVFIDQQACYDHYVNYTFTKRFKMSSFIAKPLAWGVSYFVSRLAQSARVIPVYRRSRQITRTLKESVETLQAGASVLIFPDIDYASDDSEVGRIYEGFLNLEKYYNRKTGEHIDFVPLYANQATKEILYGQAIRFDKDREFIDQRDEKAQELQDELNRLANTKVKVDLV